MPLNQNGKIDRKALPTPDLNKNIRSIHVAPKTETEIKLANLWEEILGVEKIGSEENFFEIGGHSLKAFTSEKFIYFRYNGVYTLIDIGQNVCLNICFCIYGRVHPNSRIKTKNKILKYFPLFF